MLDHKTKIKDFCIDKMKYFCVESCQNIFNSNINTLSPRGAGSDKGQGLQNINKWWILNIYEANRILIISLPSHPNPAPTPPVLRTENSPLGTAYDNHRRRSHNKSTEEYSGPHTGRGTGPGPAKYFNILDLKYLSQYWLTWTTGTWLELVFMGPLRLHWTRSRSRTLG